MASGAETPTSRGEVLIRDVLAEYDRHFGDEPAYLRDLFSREDESTVAAGIVAILRSGDRAKTLVAMDITVQAAIHHVSVALTAHLPRSGIFEALRDLLYAADHNVRSQAAVTLGKIGPRSNARFLYDALPIYLERYPLELPGLLFEMVWLSRRHRRRRWEHLERVLAAPSFLVRWSLIETLGQRDDRHDHRHPAAKLAEHMYERLAADPHPLVRTEGAYALSRLHQWWQIDPRDHPAQLQHISRQFADGPELTFTTFTWRVSALLHAMDRADYDLPLLEAFAIYLTDHPIHGKFDFAKHPQAFERWRAGRA